MTERAPFVAVVYGEAGEEAPRERRVARAIVQERLGRSPCAGALASARPRGGEDAPGPGPVRAGSTRGRLGPSFERALAHARAGIGEEADGGGGEEPPARLVGGGGQRGGQQRVSARGLPLHAETLGLHDPRVKRVVGLVRLGGLCLARSLRGSRTAPASGDERRGRSREDGVDVERGVLIVERVDVGADGLPPPHVLGVDRGEVEGVGVVVTAGLAIVREGVLLAVGADEGACLASEAPAIAEDLIAACPGAPDPVYPRQRLSVPPEYASAPVPLLFSTVPPETVIVEPVRRRGCRWCVRR